MESGLSNCRLSSSQGPTCDKPPRWAATSPARLLGSRASRSPPRFRGHRDTSKPSYSRVRRGEVQGCSHRTARNSIRRQGWAMTSRPSSVPPSCGAVALGSRRRSHRRRFSTVRLRLGASKARGRKRGQQGQVGKIGLSGWSLP